MEVMDVINRLYKNKESDKWKMIYHAALTYDVSLDTLSSILNMDKKALLNQLCLQSEAIKSKNNITDQSIAEANFIHFFVRLFNAGVDKNKDLQKEIINEVIGIDKDFKDFKKRHVEGYKLTDEDIVLTIKYQLKYWISTIKICSNDYLGMHRTNYVNRVEKLPEEYNELKQKFQILSDFYLLKYKENNGRGVRY